LPPPVVSLGPCSSHTSPAPASATCRRRSSRCRGLSAQLGWPQILVKRDDATGLAFGGNKTRKLEFLIGAAQAEGADTLLTAGGVESNDCRQTAAAAARHGLLCALVLQRRVAWNHPDYERGGNVLLDRLAGAELHVVERDAELAAELDRVAGELSSSTPAARLHCFLISTP
jgi:L-cysteate sulfo-lyase